MAGRGWERRSRLSGTNGQEGDAADRVSTRDEVPLLLHGRLRQDEWPIDSSTCGATSSGGASDCPSAEEVVRLVHDDRVRNPRPGPRHPAASFEQSADPIGDAGGARQTHPVIGRCGDRGHGAPGGDGDLCQREQRQVVLRITEGDQVAGTSCRSAPVSRTSPISWGTCVSQFPPRPRLRGTGPRRRGGGRETHRSAARRERSADRSRGATPPRRSPPRRRRTLRSRRARPASRRGHAR